MFQKNAYFVSPFILGLREGEEGEVEEVVETGDCEGPPKHSEREKVQTSPSAAGSYDNKQQKVSANHLTIETWVCVLRRHDMYIKCNPSNTKKILNTEAIYFP